MIPGVQIPNYIDYDEYTDLGPVVDWSGRVFRTNPLSVGFRPKNLSDPMQWFPKSVLRVFNKRLWVATWFAKENGLDE